MADSRLATNPTASVDPYGFLANSGEMGDRIRAFDWAGTPLGVAESWSPALRMMVRFLLANRFPLLLWWGPQYVSIYNDPYIPVLGAKHPRALGQPVSECWKEIWHLLKPLIDAPFHGGPATWNEDILLEINRHGFVEETHFTIAYSPVPDETVPSGIGGVLATVHEITEEVVGDRRVEILRDLSAQAADAKSAEEACRRAAKTLAAHNKDVPFALLYLIDANGKAARLAGSAGVAEGPLYPPMIELGASQVTPWMLSDVIRTGAMQVVADLDRRCGSSLPRGAWSDPPREAVVAPIWSNIAHQLAGVLVAGVSPRLKLDVRYRGFFELIAGQIATAVANARAYDEEKRRAEALAELDNAKTTFFSNVSHELRTPLTLMLGPIEDELRENPRNLRLELAHRNSLRLLKLVNALLDFSRLEAGRLQASYEPSDLAALTSDIASTFRSAIEKAGLKLILDCPPLPEKVYVDREMWEKIVLNLLSNAFKFTLEGEIRVSLAWRGERVELSVADSGAGIPADELPRIFERFHRVPGTRSRSHEGTGIGLALVRELAHLHGGEVKVQSVEGRGTTFTVSIQTGKSHLPAQRIGLPRAQSAASAQADAFIHDIVPGLTAASLEVLPPENEQPAAGKTRILVADDNADMRAYISRLLGEMYEVEVVADGKAALDSARAHRPDLVLTDVMMPRLDGFGLLKELRADERTRDIPVVILSARAGEESVFEGLEQGVDDYLVKPFTARELMARVRSQLNHARLRREANAELSQSFADLRKTSVELRDSQRTAVGLMEDAVRAKDALGKSEERFRAYVTASSDVVYSMSADWKEMRHLQGREFVPDTVEPSRTWLDKYIHPEDQARVLAAIDEAIRTKSVFQLEHRVIRVDGSLGWTFSRAIPVLDDKGQIVEWFGAASDVTLRKAAEEKLASQRRFYHAILSTTPDLAYVFDLNHRFVYANDSLLKMWGKTWEEAIGKTCLQLGYEPWHAAMHNDEIDRVAATKKPVRGQVPFTGTHGRRIYDYIFMPIIGADGAVEGVAGTTRDVTDQSQAAEKLEQTVADRTASLREVIEQMEEFSYSVSHDLRAPLRAIIAYADVLLDEYGEALDDTGRHYLERIRRSSDRMNRLTQDVLTYSRVARAQVQLEPIALERVIKDILHQYSQLQPPAAEIEIVRPLLDVLGHELTLGQCVANLLTNAVKFVPPGVKPHVIIRTERRGKNVRVWFQDNGIGIKPADQARVFQMFERIHPDGKYEGTGIGLTIVRKAVEKMGGSVGIESDGQNGSSFWIELRSAEE